MLFFFNLEEFLKQRNSKPNRKVIGDVGSVRVVKDNVNHLANYIKIGGWWGTAWEKERNCYHWWSL